MVSLLAIIAAAFSCVFALAVGGPSAKVAGLLGLAVALSGLVIPVPLVAALTPFVGAAIGLHAYSLARVDRVNRLARL